MSTRRTFEGMDSQDMFLAGTACKTTWPTPRTSWGRLLNSPSSTVIHLGARWQ